MISKRLTAALVAALVTTALLQGGCVGAQSVAGTSPVGQSSTGATGIDASASVESSSGSYADDAATRPTDGNVTGANLAAIEKQLEAMQRELDDLKMPNDNDFSGAEGAVY